MLAMLEKYLAFFWLVVESTGFGVTVLRVRDSVGDGVEMGVIE